MRKNLNNGFEYEYEAQLGLPKALPKNEEILWQGSPNFWAVAKHVFFIRTVAFYFALLIVFRLVEGMQDGLSNKLLLLSVAGMIALSLLGIGLLAFLAICTARTTVYTITNRRVVMRIGIVLTMTFNLPYKSIESADLLGIKNKIGNIALKVESSTKIAYFHLWPHVRSWRYTHPEPLLLGIQDVEEVAKILTNAWSQLNEQVPKAVEKKSVNITTDKKREQSIRPSLRNESSNDFAQV